MLDSILQVQDGMRGDCACTVGLLYSEWEMQEQSSDAIFFFI